MTRYALSFGHNRRTGRYCAVTTSTPDTCPPTCPLRGRGCYAENPPLLWRWNATTTRGRTLAEHLAELRAIPPGLPVRVHQAGDLPHHEGTIDRAAVLSLAAALRNKTSWTYTHHEPTPENLATIHAANAAGLVVNLSADTFTEADRLAAFDVAPVVTLAPADMQTDTRTPDGRKVRPCMKHLNPALTCDRCRLCAKRTRRFIVAFPAHGSRKQHAEAITRGAP